MKRILVLGSPGVGKSTFSRLLAEKTNLPVIHMDYYFHQKKYNQDRASWHETIRELIAADEWIMEGNYRSSQDMRFARADCIIILEIPRVKALYRVFKRHYKYKNKHRSEMPPDWQEKLQSDFIKHVTLFNSRELPRIYDKLQKYKNKRIVVLKNTKQTAEFLKNLL